MERVCDLSSELSLSCTFVILALWMPNLGVQDKHEKHSFVSQKQKGKREGEDEEEEEQKSTLNLSEE